MKKFREKILEILLKKVESNNELIVDGIDLLKTSSSHPQKKNLVGFSSPLPTRDAVILPSSHHWFIRIVRMRRSNDTRAFNEGLGFYQSEETDKNNKWNNQEKTMAKSVHLLMVLNYCIPALPTSCFTFSSKCAWCHCVNEEGDL